MRIDVQLSKKQLLAYQKLRDNVTEFLVFGGGANGGKSILGCFWLLSMCLEYPGTRYFVGREELKALRMSTLATWHKINQLYQTRLEWDFNGQDNFIKFKNGSQIDFLEMRHQPRDPLFERFGSIEYTSGWIEEGGEVSFDAYDTLKSRIGRQLNDKYNIKGKILITCNPKRNFLYTEYFKPFKMGTLPSNKAFIQSLVGDNPFREKDSIRKLETIESKAKRERLLYGNWEYEDEPDQLVKYEDLESCFNIFKADGKQTVGLDVARFGDDMTTKAKMIGKALAEIGTFGKKSVFEVANIMKKDITENSIDSDCVGIDTVGVGGGVYDILKAEGIQVKSIESGSAPLPFFQKISKHEFNNLRSQMWYLLKYDLEHKEVSINCQDPRLIEDLTAVKYYFQGNKICVESKDQIKKRIGRSTDYGDSFVYANFIRNMAENMKIEIRAGGQRVWGNGRK